MDKRLSILYLKIFTLLVFFVTVATFIGLAYLVITTENIEYYRGVVGVICLSIIPIILSICFFFKLLTFISKDRLHTKQSLNNLGRIKYSLLTVSAIYIAGMPIIFPAADKDDAPGVILIALIIIATFFTVGVFLSVVQSLIREKE